MGTGAALEVRIKAGVRVRLGLGLRVHFASGLWTQLGVRMRGRVKARDGIRIRAGLGSGSDGAGRGGQNHQLTQHQEAHRKPAFPALPSLPRAAPQLPPATSPSWGNLGTKLSTTHGHTQHQPSRPTLGERTTGTGPWSGLEVAGRGEEEVAL